MYPSAVVTSELVIPVINPALFVRSPVSVGTVISTALLDGVNAVPFTLTVSITFA